MLLASVKYLTLGNPVWPCFSIIIRKLKTAGDKGKRSMFSLTDLNSEQIFQVQFESWAEVPNTLLESFWEWLHSGSVLFFSFASRDAEYYGESGVHKEKPRVGSPRPWGTLFLQSPATSWFPKILCSFTEISWCPACVQERRGCEVPARSFSPMAAAASLALRRQKTLEAVETICFSHYPLNLRAPDN